MRVVVMVASFAGLVGCSAVLGFGGLPGLAEPPADGGGDETATTSDGEADGEVDGAATDAAALRDARLDADASAACVDGGVDADTDPHNCGGCGHDCLGATCAAGICGSKTLISGDAVDLVVTDDTSVFWIGAGIIKKMSIGGSASQTLSSPGLSNGGLVLDGTKLYYSNRSNGYVESVGVAGGPTTLIATGGYAVGVALDTQNVYWSNGGRAPESFLVRSAKTTLDGGFGTVISNDVGPAYPVRVQVSDGYLYWLSIDDPGDVPNHYIRRVPLTGNFENFVPVVNATPGIRAFAVDSQHVYYSTPLGYIARVDLDGSNFVQLVDQTDASEIHVSGNEIFWSTLDTKVMKARKSDGQGRVTLYDHKSAAGIPTFTVGSQYVVLSATATELIRVPR